jgi:signal transduction histidine kinase
MKAKKILIVDDEPNGFDVIEALLFPEGYQLNYVSNGIKALHRLESDRPDLILLDVMMPEMDGIEVCRRIKSDPDLHHIPTVMVTALNSKEDMARCLDAGADDFVGKPVSGIELRARVKSMLRIKEQYDRLKATLQLRDDLSQAIVHDLKNPLSSIILVAETLTRSQLEEKHKQKVQQIIKDVEKLRSMADDLLLMSKAESGKLKPQLAPVDLSELATKVVADMSAIAANKTIEIVTKLPETSQHLSLDASLFYRVFANLLSNAIKFSPKKSQVTVEVLYPDDDNQKAQIKVADCGFGVSPQIRESIFAKFEIGEVLDNIPQTGIGLAFCRMVVEAHHGEILVEDNQPQGAIFVINLPKSKI